jgi:Neutral/alkaline non-lysosomal ceramidase, N-terminal
VPLRVPAGTPLGGYGGLARRRLFPDVFGQGHAFWFKTSRGTLDPLAVRALVLEDRAARLVWVTLDAIAVDRAFTDLVRSRTSVAGKPTTVIVSASHTHAGPGAFLEPWLMGVVAADRFDPAVREAMVSAAVEAVTRAHEHRRAARLATAGVNAPDVGKSRLAQPLDPELLIIKIAAPSGAPIAVVWNHAIHGTMLPPSNLQFSGDVMGIASNALEHELGVPALFVNGALGDVSPRAHGREAARAAGAALAATVRTVWQRLRPESSAALAVRSLRVALPAPSVSLRNCLTRWLPGVLHVPLDGAVPGEMELTAVAFGDTVVLTIPGELETRLGLTLKRAARPAWRHAVVAGVSNDYLGYFVSAPAYDRPAYVTCASLYGREGGDRITAAGADLLRALAGAVTSPGGAIGTPGWR